MLQPVLQRYLEGLGARVRKMVGRKRSRIFVMQSSGGIAPLVMAGAQPVRTVLSGPAGFDNNYTGSTNVASGTLVLSKTGVAVPGNLTIGTGTAGNSATVLFQGDQQLAPTSVVTVNSDGIYNQNSHVQTIGGLQITDGTALTGTQSAQGTTSDIAYVASKHQKLDRNSALASFVRTVVQIALG